MWGGVESMTGILIQIVLNAVLLWIVGQLVKGIEVRDAPLFIA